MLLLITVMCVWLGLKVEAARKQREAIAVIRQAYSSAAIQYDYELSADIFSPLKPRPERSWLAKCLGDDFVYDVAFVTIICKDSPADPEDVRSIFPYLANFRHLRCLVISSGSFTDEDFKFLTGLKDLEILVLDRNGIAGSRLSCLQESQKLRWISITRNPIDDSSVEAVANLPSLETVSFADPRQAIRQGEDTKITEACFDPLARLPKLKRLTLPNFEIASKRIEAIEQMFANVELRFAIR